MNKIQTKKIIQLSAAITASALLAAMIPANPRVLAGSLTSAWDYLGRETQNLTAGETHTIIFKPTNAVSGGQGNNKVILIFPDTDDGKWCATAGNDLDVSTENLPDSATALPGSLNAACTQGSGDSSYDTITISGVNNLTAGTLYGVKVSDGTTGKLGTPSTSTTGIITIKTNNGSADVDSENIAVAIIADDQVMVTATVNPMLSFAITQPTVNLGTLTTTSTGSGTATMTAATNALSGYVINVSGNTLTNVIDENKTITAMVGAGSTPGTSQFGMNLVANTSPAVGSDPSGGSGAAATGYGTANQFKFNSGDIVASAAAPSLTTTYTVSYIANVSADVIAGNYSATHTYVCTGHF